MNSSPRLSRPVSLALAALIGASVALSGTPARAQQPAPPSQPSEIELLRQQVAELQARLERLEAR